MCFVGITANGNDLAAQFVIAAENIGTGMRLSETIAEAPVFNSRPLPL